MRFDGKNHFTEKKIKEIKDRKAKRRSLRSRARKYISLSIAVILTFTTVYTLILNAITLDNDTASSMPGIVLDAGDNEETVEVRELSAEPAETPSEQS